MGIVREILSEYKADASEHIAELRKLKGAITEEQATELEAHEARNEQMESHLASLAKWAVAIGAIKEASEIVFDGYKEGLHEARLETAATGVNIEELSKAAGGLKTNLELLEFAAKANNSAFKNTQEDMEVAERAIRKLEARGVPTADAVDAITNAVVGAKVKGLVPLGIVVDTHIDKLAMMGEENLTAAQKTEVHSAAMKSLREFTEGTSDAQENLGDSMKSTEVKLADSWAQLKIGLGNLAEGFKPLLEAISKAIEGYALLAKGLLGGSPLSIQSIKDAVTGDSDKARAYKAKMVGDYFSTDEAPKGGEAGPAEIEMGEMHLLGKEERAAMKKATEEAARERERRAKAVFEDIFADLQAENKSLAYASAGVDQDKQKEWDEKQARERAMYRAMTEQRNEQDSRGSRYAAFEDRQAAGQNSKLAKIFGPVGDFDIYKEAFKGLETAVGGAMNAWIDGSMSAGQAFHKFIGDALKGLAIQMGIESLKHAAYAIGNLAFYNFDAAGKHAIAAAEFGAGAIAAGVAASVLGAGGSSPATGAGAPQTYSGGSGGDGQQQQGPTIVYGDSFSDDSPRMRQIKAKKLVGLALGSSAGVHS